MPLVKPTFHLLFVSCLSSGIRQAIHGQGLANRHMGHNSMDFLVLTAVLSTLLFTHAHAITKSLSEAQVHLQQPQTMLTMLEPHPLPQRVQRRQLDLV